MAGYQIYKSSLPALTVPQIQVTARKGEEELTGPKTNRAFSKHTHTNYFSVFVVAVVVDVEQEAGLRSFILDVGMSSECVCEPCVNLTLI